MKKILVTTLFILAMSAWAVSQQQGGIPGQNTGQVPSPNSGLPAANQSQSPATGGAAQGGAQSGMQAGQQGQAANVPVTEGCLSGSAPNFTITDQAGTVYKLNIPASADTSKLAQHVGESARVAGNLEASNSPGNASIDVQGIGRGTGKCPASASGAAQPQPKQ